MSVIPSPWHILVCALREVSSGEFDRTEDGKSVDSAPRSQGRSCKVDRVVKATVPIRFQWMLPGGGGVSGMGGALTASAKATTNHQAWKAVAGSHGCRFPENLDLGMTRRLGPSVATLILTSPLS